MMRNRQIVLANRPHAVPASSDFKIVEAVLPPLTDGEFVVRHEYLALAPSARLRMTETPGYPRTAIGEVVSGHAVGRIVDSRNDRFKIGQYVHVSNAGWQELSIRNGDGIECVDVDAFSPSMWLGILGGSGNTAYVGMLEIGRPKPNDVVVVSAASGAVGSVAGQIARLCGGHVVGITGGQEKCSYVRGELQFDECIDYKASTFSEDLKRVCRTGVDIYYDNVGGFVRDSVFELMKVGSRIVVCGSISEYAPASEASGPSWMPILVKEISIKGFRLASYADLRPNFLRDVTNWMRQGKIKAPREFITKGFENTPSAFIAMLEGGKIGKSIVDLT